MIRQLCSHVAFLCLVLLCLRLWGCQATPQPPRPESLRPLLELIVRDGTVVALVNRPEIALLVVRITQEAEALLQDPPDFAVLHPTILRALDQSHLQPYQSVLVGQVIIGMLTLASTYLDRHQIDAAAKALYARDILHWIRDGAGLVSPPL